MPSDRFGEKRTLSLRLPKLNRKTSALPSEADIQLISVKGSANDPKRPLRISLQQTDFELILVRFPPILGLREP